MAHRRLQLSLAFAAGLLLSPNLAKSQWLNYKASAIPRLPNGKPDMNAPAPKNAEGKPDIAGVWTMPGPPLYMLNITKDLKPDEVSMKPWAEALYAERKNSESKDDPSASCVPGGVPRSWLPPYPFKIVNSPGEVIVLHEAIHSYRQIFTDGRELPKDPNPTWMGYSVGKWDGDTFVVDTIGFKDKAWLDNNGHPGSDALHVTERLHRKNLGHMDIQVTINDPKTYNKPWTATLPLTLDPDSELLEFICSENERDSRHMVGK